MELSKEENKLIERVALDNGFSDYQVIATPGSTKGDNFLGIVTAVTIKNGKKTLELFLKSAHTNEAFRKLAPLRQAYEREIYLYERVFPEFKKFQEECNISDPFNSVAKAYTCSTEDGHECFIMENLKTTGYQLWDKKIPMNSEHITAVLKEYAKFHAISFAMKVKNPKLFAEISKRVESNIFEDNDLVTKEEKLNAYIKGVMASAYKALEDDILLTECLQRLEAELPDLFKTGLKDPEYKLIINHGDCWCNNFMFKYENSKDTKKPSSLRIIDWQLSAVSSPAVDICYFFLAHSTRNTLEEIQKYLKIYHDTLSDRLREFKCDPEQVFSYECLEKHVKKYIKFGLFMSFMIIKVMICDSDEAPDFAEISEKDSDFAEGLNFAVKNVEVYNKRIKDLVQFLNENDCI